MLNDWSHKVRAILKEYCPGNIEKILPSSQNACNTRFYFGHQKLCMDNNTLYMYYLYIKHKPRWDGTVVSMSTSRVLSCVFTPRSGHTIYHHKNPSSVEFSKRQNAI